jgi:D-alanine-D-alanine ligase
MELAMQTKQHPTIKGRPELPHVAVLMGGMSSEREVSLSSGESVIESLTRTGYTITPIDMGRDVAIVLHNLKPNVVFNALHGTYCEDGCVSGMLDIMGIPYTHSSVIGSALAFDKIVSQNILISNGIKCPDRVIVHKEQNIQSDPMPRPYVVKPYNQGSSIGVEVVFKEDNFDFKNYQFEYGSPVIVEKYIPGRELDVAVFNGKALGICEIVTKGRKFRDYTVKYEPGFSDKLIPAPLTKEQETKLFNLSERICTILKSGEASRAEFKFDEQGDGEFYFLELNTHPGFTKLSILAKIAEHAGINFDNLLTIMIDNALSKNKELRTELIT